MTTDSSAMDGSYDFTVRGFPLRVHCGADALNNLPAEMKRLRARRAFIVTGRSIARVGLLARVEAILGDLHAGSFAAIGKDTPVEDVIAATQQAEAVSADLIIAIGAGSVVQAGRVVAILMAEKAPIETLITRYPEDGPAIAARLEAPKLPIINVLTVGTTAQNRGGSPVKAPGGAKRMEFFDPKTRPQAIFWDHDALLTAPSTMVRNSAAAMWWRSVMDMGHRSGSLIAQYTYRNVFDLMDRTLTSPGGADSLQGRLNLCIASFLQNRCADDGGGPVAHWVSRVTYAFSTSLFNLHDHVSQGVSYAVLTAPVLRRLGHRDPAAMHAIADALGVLRPGMTTEQVVSGAADAIAARFQAMGMPRNLTDLNVPRESCDIIVGNSLSNFNADPKREFVREKDLLRSVLLDCW